MKATTRKRGDVLCFTGLLVVSWVFGSGWAHAEILYDKDGIQLQGTAQIVQSGGGTCNVLESDTDFEERQANHGAPMDIWRLDFSVRNGSSRWLDHLIAIFQIASEWPECTNWDVPDATELALQYPSAHIEWGGSAGHIGKSGRNVVSPGQTLTDTKLLIVLRGDPEPRFSTWSLNFDFATHPPPPGTSSPAASAADRPSATSEQESLFWQSILGCTNPSDFEAYLKQFPNGSFRALAEALLAMLRDRPEGPPSVEPLRVDSTADSGESDFGDDTGRWAEDGECDDPRFEGPGMGLTDNEDALGHDATDCRELLEAGLISRTNVDAVAPSTNPAAAGGKAHLLVWSAIPSDEHDRILIYIDGEWQVNRDVWWTWRNPPPDCNYRETYPEAYPYFSEVSLEPGQYRLRAAAIRTGGFRYDDHGFGRDVLFAVEETIDLQPGCNVFEIVRP